MVYSRNTLFIIGAGASKEFGLPIGLELATGIASRSAIIENYVHSNVKDQNIWQAIGQLANSKQESTRLYLEASKIIHDAMPYAPSIDNFLDVHHVNKHIEVCGKLAICASIIEAEKSSSLFVNQSNIHNKIVSKQIESS
jgi:hypothetical protein